MGHLLDVARNAADPNAAAETRHVGELRRLIAKILPNDTQAERDWTLSVAVRDRENALVSFRTLVEELSTDFRISS